MIDTSETHEFSASIAIATFINHLGGWKKGEVDVEYISNRHESMKPKCPPPPYSLPPLSEGSIRGAPIKKNTE